MEQEGCCRVPALHQRTTLYGIPSGCFIIFQGSQEEIAIFLSFATVIGVLSVATEKPSAFWMVVCYLNNQPMAKCRLEVPLTFASSQPDSVHRSARACNEVQMRQIG